MSTLFAKGGHRAFSELHLTLHTELVVIKFTQRVTWAQALAIWSAKYASSMSAASMRSRHWRDDDDSSGGGGGGGCWTCGSYGHQARDCYY